MDELIKQQKASHALDRILQAFGNNEMTDAELAVFVGERLREVYGPKFIQRGQSHTPAQNAGLLDAAPVAHVEKLITESLGEVFFKGRWWSAEKMTNGTVLRYGHKGIVEAETPETYRLRA